MIVEGKNIKIYLEQKRNEINCEIIPYYIKLF